MGFRNTSQANPQLNTQDIKDLYIRNNFQAIANFFTKENQLVGFKHLTFSFTEAQTNSKVQHGLGYVPQDVIITRITGTGILSLNWSLFDSASLDVTSTGPCEVRMFVGTYTADLTAQSLPLSNQELQAIIPPAPTL